MYVFYMSWGLYLGEFGIYLRHILEVFCICLRHMLEILEYGFGTCWSLYILKAYLGGFGTCLRHVLEFLAHGLMHILVILVIWFGGSLGYLGIKFMWFLGWTNIDDYGVSLSMIVIMTGWFSHLYFREEGRGKKRGLQPPSSWSWRI